VSILQNILVLGTNFSKQVYLKPGRCVLVCPRLFHRGCEANNGKGSTVNLSKEIIGTDNSLGESSNYQLKNRVEQAIPSHIPTDRCVIM